MFCCCEIGNSGDNLISTILRIEEYGAAAEILRRRAHLGVDDATQRIHDRDVGAGDCALQKCGREFEYFNVRKSPLVWIAPLRRQVGRIHAD